MHLKPFMGFPIGVRPGAPRPGPVTQSLLSRPSGPPSKVLILPPRRWGRIRKIDTKLCDVSATCRGELTDVDENTMIGKRGDFPETKLAKDRPQRLGVLQNPDHCVHPGAIDHGLRGAGVPGRAILDGTDPAPAGPGVGR